VASLGSAVGAGEARGGGVASLGSAVGAGEARGGGVASLKVGGKLSNEHETLDCGISRTIASCCSNRDLNAAVTALTSISKIRAVGEADEFLAAAGVIEDGVAVQGVVDAQAVSQVRTPEHAKRHVAHGKLLVNKELSSSTFEGFWQLAGPRASDVTKATSQAAPEHAAGLRARIHARHQERRSNTVQSRCWRSLCRRRGGNVEAAPLLRVHATPAAGTICADTCVQTRSTAP
jgi:hypothetical protein